MSFERAPWWQWAQVEQLPRSGEVAGEGVIRARPEDFRVEELASYEPTGEGEHLWLWVEKRGENTEAVATRLARAAGVKAVAVGYAGRKDRHAVTRQWFSVQLPGVGDTAIPDGFVTDNIRVLNAVRSAKKLRVGALRGNRFMLRLRDVKADDAVLASRLEEVSRNGVPNYFGEQRFGRDGRNLISALGMFGGRRERDRKRRGLYLSAARSALFNGILAQRVVAGTWNTLCPGEAVMLDGSNSFFVADEIDESLRQRLREGDVHPSGALWGRGQPQAGADLRALEEAVAAQAVELASGLEAAGLKQERRPLRLLPKSLVWEWDAAAGLLELEFVLPAGAFATAVLRDILDYRVSAPAGD